MCLVICFCSLLTIYIYKDSGYIGRATDLWLSGDLKVVKAEVVMYLIDFSQWEVFVNDDCTRSFLSVEVRKEGLAEIKKQIQAVNEVYKLHNLPEFYKDPRPHISIAWGMGDISDLLKRVVVEALKEFTGLRGYAGKCIFTCKFSGINCKIGNKAYEICKFQE
ncbi:hypothetical protein RHMOL_Rhmol03G0183800 [Rhododendron molle]|uniref:Uncharacterized protein n=1 Tax=Rhododendron molle TaxID=49168 RepID=A0ACC0PG93_RHOML|nr:hypothetical protein RHMOL_Rhmol03G0183800 [Rhododendron molle]